MLHPNIYISTRSLHTDLTQSLVTIKENLGPTEIRLGLDQRAVVSYMYNQSMKH